MCVDPYIFPCVHMCRDMCGADEGECLPTCSTRRSHENLPNFSFMTIRLCLWVPSEANDLTAIGARRQQGCSKWRERSFALLVMGALALSVRSWKLLSGNFPFHFLLNLLSFLDFQNSPLGLQCLMIISLSSSLIFYHSGFSTYILQFYGSCFLLVFPSHPEAN